MMSRLLPRFVVRASILCAINLSLLTVAHAQVATDFAIFSTDDVTLATYSVVAGDVYSGRDLTVEFGYGIQVPDLNAGNMFALENYAQESLSDVNGNVFVNGNVTLEGSADIFFDLTYGGTYTASSSADVEGVAQQLPNSVPTIALPTATQFSTGNNDVISDSSLSLAPGAHRDVELTSSFDQLILTSGNYYLRSLNLGTSTTISLQIINNEPINVFIEGDADFSSGLNVLVNGVDIEDADLVGSVSSLASLVLFEVHGNVLVDSGFTSAFFGTIFAPSGNVDVDLQDMYGSIISGRPVTAEVYLRHHPSDYLIGQIAPPALLGDCNLDGVVSFLDIFPFIGSLSSTTGEYLEEADCNHDGVISFLDIAPFIAILTAV